jgi:hypothetical protein
MYQPKTGAKCSCISGIQRDNCPNCEGTGYIIDFAKIRSRNVETRPVGGDHRMIRAIAEDIETVFDLLTNKTTQNENL